MQESKTNNKNINLSKKQIEKINSPKNYNISMLSKQKQLQLNKNKILLINLTSSMTELARLLIVGGFNIYLYDKETINENDINNNIFLNKSDFGKKRMDAIYNYLLPLSPTVNITKINDYTLIKDYKIAIVGFSNFLSLIEYEEYFNRKDILFFCLNSSGLYLYCSNTTGSILVMIRTISFLVSPLIPHGNINVSNRSFFGNTF